MINILEKIEKKLEKNVYDEIFQERNKFKQKHSILSVYEVAILDTSYKGKHAVFVLWRLLFH